MAHDQERMIIALPPRLTAEDVEGLAESTQGRQFDLDPYHLKETSFGADARLLGWLARHNLAGDRPTLRVPRYGAERQIPGKATRELAFFVMSRMASQSILDGEDVSRDLFKAQGRKLLEFEGRLVTPSVRAYFYDHQFPGLPLVPELEPVGRESPLRFRSALRKELYELGLADPVRRADPPPPELLVPVREFLGEALNNARQHATTDLRGDSIKGLAFVSLRSYFYREAVNDYATSNDAISGYMTALRDRFGGDLRDLRFAEFTVADSGIGIAHHYARRQQITFTTYSEEVDVLQDAFHMSDAAPAGSWIGVGLYKMLRAARDVNGLILLRTGHVEATRHYLGSGTTDPLSVEPRATGRALLGGTAVSLIVPWVDLEAPTLPFIDG